MIGHCPQIEENISPIKERRIVMIDHYGSDSAIKVTLGDASGFLARGEQAQHRLTFRVSEQAYVCFMLTTDELRELVTKGQQRLTRTGNRRQPGTQQPLVEGPMYPIDTERDNV